MSFRWRYEVRLVVRDAVPVDYEGIDVNRCTASGGGTQLSSGFPVGS